MTMTNIQLNQSYLFDRARLQLLLFSENGFTGIGGACVLVHIKLKWMFVNCRIRGGILMMTFIEAIQSGVYTSIIKVVICQVIPDIRYV